MAGQGSDAGYRWSLPAPRQPGEPRELRVYNSYSRKKEPFVAVDRKSVRWYCCGPTVYDVAHLGHARCYITFDIIRRILTDYFGYQLFYAMNITDIDDKIIKRARSNHLCDRFIEHWSRELAERGQQAKRELLERLNTALEGYEARRRPSAGQQEEEAKLALVESVLLQSRQAVQQLLASEQVDQQRVGPILERLRDIIADQQDVELGHTLGQQHDIFRALSHKFELEFHQDMRALGVLEPSALARVSEYMHELGKFIKRLEQNGYAYRSNGSIYFDTRHFDAQAKHSYAKLVREAYGHSRRELEEAEGELSSGDEKRSPSDFALWKRSKPGEPQWREQDFEPGRPGWHIECSAMASELLGESFDIHSGGCDLKFPHHDNELAQAEAYYDTGANWVNYFIHSGHLTISGCKMSKSLKNFVTIRQALEQYSARQLRFAFLAHGWTETLDYSANTMSTALSYEKTFREFLLNVCDALRRRRQQQAQQQQQFAKWHQHDLQLNELFLATVNKLDAALCDNFDTRTALGTLTLLVRECNKRPDVNPDLLKQITSYISKILTIFGLNFAEIHLDQYLEPAAQQVAVDQQQQADSSQVAMKYVEALAEFRAQVRRISKGADAQQSVNQLLALCDQLRDHTLPSLGVRLEDKQVEGAEYVVKFVDAQTLAKERAAAEKKEQDNRLRLERQRLEKLKLQQEREQKAKIPPSEMFKQQTDKYSKFDQQGLPTHDSTGEQLSKSALKKVQKLYAEQETRYAKYMASNPPTG